MRLDSYAVGIVVSVCVALSFITLFVVIWQGTVSGQQAELSRMTACVENDRNWLFNEDANDFECKP